MHDAWGVVTTLWVVRLPVLKRQTARILPSLLLALLVSSTWKCHKYRPFQKDQMSNFCWQNRPNNTTILLLVSHRWSNWHVDLLLVLEFIGIGLFHTFETS